MKKQLQPMIPMSPLALLGLMGAAPMSFFPLAPLNDRQTAKVLSRTKIDSK